MLVGQTLGPFEIEREIGSGAMGSVYRARYTKTGRPVAVKIIAPGLCGNESAVKRFEREITVLKQLNHPNIVRLLANGRYHKTPFYAMEYVEGESLDKVLERRSRFTWEEVVELGKQLCAALQHAHHQGIVHRDLKPSNVMVLRDGTVKLTDFGIAKDLDVTGLTSAHCTVGTAAYMSPEQCRGERNLTHKSDLYSMGVMFYELLTGRKPFQAETTMDMFIQHTQGTFERPSRLALEIPVWLDTLICQLLEKKPEHRPFDAATVGTALEQVVEKVSAGRSAGVDAARARVIDRGQVRGKPDEADKEAARTLLTGMKGGKRGKQPKEPAFYERGWFQGIALTLLLAAVGSVLYVAFKPAPPEQLFAQAQKLMASADPTHHDQARTGPIQEYLDRYGGLGDEQTRQVRAWADAYDAGLKEKQLNNRRRMKVSPEGDERIAFEAMDHEAANRYGEALKRWQELVKYRDDPDAGQRALGLVAVKKAEELERVTGLEEDLRQKLVTARADRQNLNVSPDGMALKALLAEQFGDAPLAHERWSALTGSDQRALSLLARAKAAELKKAAPERPEELEEERVGRVQKRLAEAKAMRETNVKEARDALWDIVSLYHDSMDARLQPLITEAAQTLKQLTNQQ